MSGWRPGGGEGLGIGDVSGGRQPDFRRGGCRGVFRTPPGENKN